jgi:hypothetical protein
VSEGRWNFLVSRDERSVVILRLAPWPHQTCNGVDIAAVNA